MMLSRISSVLSFCFVSIIVIHLSLAATRSRAVNFKTMLPTSSIVLTCLRNAGHWFLSPNQPPNLRSFEPCIGFLSNPVFCAKFFLLLTFISLNNSAPSYLSYISLMQSCIFRLASSARLPTLYSFVFYLLTSSLMADVPSSSKGNITLEQPTLPCILPVTVDWAIKTNVHSLILYTL